MQIPVITLTDARQGAARVAQQTHGPTPPDYVARVLSDTAAKERGIPIQTGREDGDTRDGSPLPIQIYFRAAYTGSGWDRAPDCYNIDQVTDALVLHGPTAVAVVPSHPQ